MSQFIEAQVVVENGHLVQLKTPRRIIPSTVEEFKTSLAEEISFNMVTSTPQQVGRAAIDIQNVENSRAYIYPQYCTPKSTEQVLS